MTAPAGHDGLVAAGAAAVLNQQEIGGALLPDQECAQALWLLGLRRNICHDGSRRAAACPVHEAVNILGSPFEDCLDLAIGKVAHPPAHPVLTRHPLAGIAEEDVLNLAGDQNPVANHNQTLRRDQ